MVVPIDNATGNINLHCKRFHDKGLGLNVNLCTDTYNKINKLSANNIFDKNKIYLKIKFNIDNIRIENH